MFITNISQTCVSFCQLNAEQQEMSIMESVRKSLDFSWTEKSELCNGSLEDSDQVTISKNNCLSNLKWEIISWLMENYMNCSHCPVILQIPWFRNSKFCIKSQVIFFLLLFLLIYKSQFLSLFYVVYISLKIKSKMIKSARCASCDFT